MSEADFIIMPNRPSDVDVLPSKHLFEVYSLRAREGREGDKFWNLIPGPSGVEEPQAHPLPRDLNVVGRWLLEAADNNPRDLISPYAKLDIIRLSREESNPRNRYASLRHKYSFRLVNMEPAPAGHDDADEALKLVEFKLLAGTDFWRANDHEARLAGTIAVSNFILGQLSLHNPEPWEAGFPTT